MRMIDADKLNLLLGISDRDIYAKYMLDRMPTIDAVSVVRCRECKHHHDCGTHFCDALGMDCPDDSEFFCSYGKRKEGAE